MNNLIVKVINNQRLPDDEVAKEIILAEGRMNSTSQLRFHIESNLKERVEATFKNRCIEQRVKWGSKKFYELQLEFFSGACAALNEIPASWGICLMSKREIINEYKL